MNAAYKNNSFSALLGSFLMVALVATLSFGLVHTAHAQDDGYDYSSYDSGYDSGSAYDYGYNGGCCDYGGYDYSSVDSGYDYTPSGYDYTPVDSGYDYTPVNSGYDYTPIGTTASSGSGSSFGISLGGSLGGGTTYRPVTTYAPTTYPTYTYTPAPSYTNVNTNTNTNVNTTSSYCSGSNVCNTTSTVTNPTPVVVTQPVYPQPIPVAVVTPVTPVSTNPYVSLSQLPYTGLELGFWGTIAYWGFLIFWCLLAAYLITVKRIQNKFVAFLFGEKEVHASTPMSRMPQQNLAAVHQNRSEGFAQASIKPVFASQSVDPVDAFIMGQIQRRAQA